MKFSVIVPLYNKASYVAETLQSVVNQKKWPDELIVVDDASTDGSAERVEAFFRRAPELFLQHTHVRFVRLPENKGISVARNTGFDHSTGDVVTFLDADDLYTVDFLERISDLFENQRADMVVLRVKLFPSGISYPNFEALKQYFEPLGNDAYRMNNPLKVVTSHQYVIGVGSNVVVRREWMEKERFLETIRFYEGIDCWYRHFRRLATVQDACIIQLQGNYLNVREVRGSASRRKFAHWKQAPFPPILERYEHSTYKHDHYMMGLMRGRWIMHSMTNMPSFRQKTLFILNHRKQFIRQLGYSIRRIDEMWKLALTSLR